MDQPSPCYGSTSCGRPLPLWGGFELAGTLESASGLAHSKALARRIVLVLVLVLVKPIWKSALLVAA